MHLSLLKKGFYFFFVFILDFPSVSTHQDNRLLSRRIPLFFLDFDYLPNPFANKQNPLPKE